MAIVATNFWLGQRAQSYFDNAIEARDTRIAAVELRNAMQTAEASERGFVITGNEIYLGPYQTAKAQAQRHLKALQALLTTYPDSESTLRRLSAILITKFDELDQTIALKRDNRDAEILAIFRTNRGKALTDEANVFFSGIIGRADDRLTSGVAEQRANSRWLRLVSAIGGLVIVAVVAGAAYGAARYTRELRDTRDQVNELNSELEERVAARTEDLAKARDRAEVLLSEVNHRVANSLALVSSLVNLQSKAVADSAAKDALAETHDRILAISMVHRRLYGSSDVRSVSMNEYLAGLLDHLRTSLRAQVQGVSLTYHIEPIELETDTSISLGVVVTELVTNAFKYAYPGGVGEVRVGLGRLADDQAELVVEDDGIGRTDGAPAKGTGVGSRIINAMCMNLGARIDYRLLQPGTAAHLVFSTKPRRAASVQ
ncbi:sensor histidine kinase [Mesorhizobium sp. ES1-1]|uniref:sensor histidine kinase n=1 Tax=Mesorhizobium sp. ES1-1 TaxID=2876629 RepID=UPI001CCFDD6E|nr:CHASE3 domain-containing protein [Mesorhizobium sp. ES1-1]MBZ9676951.1 CHASE3 domain-containing protein [Mesorhizobium sp. ES1-1]